MINDQRFRSRKFLLAFCSLAVISAMGLFAVGAACLAGSFAEAAMLMASWTAADAAILKLYNDANLKDEGGNE